MKIINKFKKSEKGSITMMVLTVMLFMLIVVTVSYFGISNKSIGQNKKISRISEQYQVTDEDMEQEFQEVVNSLKVQDYIKIGDYVDYDPTKIDANKTQAVDSNKLTYTSPTGTILTDDTEIITHGNGYVSEEEGGGQTFTAKANDGSENGLKWRVFSVSEDRVELISEDVLPTDTENDFVLQGGIGYMYAEQELNEICKIYGYGYGADITQITKYTVGGPEDTPIIGQIKESGARSITVEDVNKKAGIYEENGTMKYGDGTVIDDTYGSTEKPIKSIYYPTLYSNDITYPGKSANVKLGFKNTYYKWSKSQIEDTTVRDMLFSSNCVLASRSIHTYDTYAYFSANVINAGGGGVGATSIVVGQETVYGGYTTKNLRVRPIVTLKPDVIDLSINYEKDNVWRLK